MENVSCLECTWKSYTQCWQISFWRWALFLFSSPKGLRAESARAFTGRRCTHSGKGEDFLTGQPDFFYGNSCNSGTESRKWFPRWIINHHAEGWKWVIDQNWGRMANIGFFGQKPRFWAQKNIHFWGRAMFWPRPKKVVQKKVAFAQIIIAQNIILGDFLG